MCSIRDDDVKAMYNTIYQKYIRNYEKNVYKSSIYSNILCMLLRYAISVIFGFRLIMLASLVFKSIYNNIKEGFWRKFA